MIRTLLAAVVIVMSANSAVGQQTPVTPSQMSATPSAIQSELPSKSEGLRLISIYERAATQPDTSRFSHDDWLKIYEQLAILYQAIGMYKKSADAAEHAVQLLRDGPPKELADELSLLSVIHVAGGEMHDAEKELLEAQSILENVGDPIDIAVGWSNLADLYLEEHKSKQAMELAQKAIKVMGDSPAVSGSGRILVRQTLGAAMCERHQCEQAIPILKDAIELARATYGQDSLAAGLAEYILGTAYWRQGDLVDAADRMQRGTERMKRDMGWGHPAYIAAMANYARFLRQRGQMEAAANAESEAVRANSVVDVRSFTGRH